MTVNTFNELKVRVGWIVIFVLDLNDDSGCEVSCTVWPDTHNILNDKTICIDDAVIRGKLNNSWCQCTCQVREVNSPRIATSVYTSISTLNGSLRGLSVRTGFTIGTSSIRKSELKITSVGGGGNVAVVGPNTIVICDKKRVVQTTKEQPTVACSTKLVQDLINLIVRPNVHESSTIVSSCYTIRGILLLGPPGTGKSYSLRAVKTLCQDWCEVVVHAVDISALLADSTQDPMKILSETLSACDGGVIRPKQPMSTTPGGPLSPALIPAASSGTKTPKPPPLSVSYTSSASASCAGITIASPFTPDSPLRPRTLLSPQSSQTPRFSHSSPSSAVAASATSLPLTPGVRDLPKLHVLFIDEVDALGGASDASSMPQSDTQVAVKVLLCNWMDGLNNGATNRVAHKVAVVATSNRSSDVDPTLRRGGRLEIEYEVEAGGVADRVRMLQGLLTSPSCLLSESFSGADSADLLEALAETTGGYTAADLVALVSEVANLATASACETFATIPHDKIKLLFRNAKLKIGPSCLRGATVSLPKIRLDDVIGHTEEKLALVRLLSLSAPTPAQRRRYEHFGLTSGLGGALLYGPPGNGKTRLVLAAAAELGLPVVALSTADVFSPYVGDAEAAVRRAFSLARQSAPCVLLLDELDAIVGDRDREGSPAETRVLATMLNEMDGIGGGCNGVIVMGATNRVDSIDAALLRKGRFHHLLHIGLPTEKDSKELLSYFCRRSGLSEMEENQLRDRLRPGISGAEVENLCRESAMARVRDVVQGLPT